MPDSMETRESHPTEEQLKCYVSGTLQPSDLLSVSAHAASCPRCRGMVMAIKAPASRAALHSLSAGGEPAFHLSYEMMRDQVDGKLDEVDKEVVADHIRVCGACREELMDLAAFKTELEREAALTTSRTVIEAKDRQQQKARHTRSWRERLAEWWEGTFSQWMLVGGVGVTAALALAMLVAGVARNHGGKKSASSGDVFVLTRPKAPSTEALPPISQPPPKSPSPDVVKDGPAQYEIADRNVKGLPDSWPSLLKEDVSRILGGGSLDRLRLNGVATLSSETLSPDPAANSGKPANYSVDEVKKLAPASHLATGVALWKAGDLAEARREFEKFAAENPDSTIAQKLLREATTSHESR